MKTRLAALIAGFAVCAGPALAAEACPPLPDAPPIDPSARFLLPKTLRKVAPPRRHTPMPQAPLADIHIKLTRAHCLDTCTLNSSVELNGDGAGVYRGEDDHLLVRGEHRFQLAPGAMACLVEAVRNADFWSLAPAYVVDEPPAEMSTLEVEVAGERKSVKEREGVYVGAPSALIRLMLAVEAAGAQSFLTGDALTVPLLEAEHFDFRSRAGAVLLSNAAHQSPDEVVLAILAKGAPANQKAWINGLEGDSAIEAAAMQGKLDIVRALIAAGAFKDAPYEMREDALRAAVKGARPAVAEELIRNGADVKTRDEDGEGIFSHLGDTWDAERKEDPTFAADRLAVIKLLLAAGAPVPPNILFDLGTPEEVKLFVAAGADLEARNRSGETPLLDTYDEDTAIALLEAGADREAKGEDGKTIAIKARDKETGMPRVLDWLRTHP